MTGLHGGDDAQFPEARHILRLTDLDMLHAMTAVAFAVRFLDGFIAVKSLSHRAVAAAMALIKAHRMHGHLAAHLDPLGSEPPGEPALEDLRYDPPLTPELQARIPASLLRLSVPGETLLDALPRLREVYTGSSAYEIEHISDHAERAWLRPDELS